MNKLKAAMCLALAGVAVKFAYDEGKINGKVERDYESYRSLFDCKPGINTSEGSLYFRTAYDQFLKSHTEFNNIREYMESTIDAAWISKYLIGSIDNTPRYVAHAIVSADELVEELGLLPETIKKKAIDIQVAFNAATKKRMAYCLYYDDTFYIDATRKDCIITLAKHKYITPVIEKLSKPRDPSEKNDSCNMIAISPHLAEQELGLEAGEIDADMWNDILSLMGIVIVVEREIIITPANTSHAEKWVSLYRALLSNSKGKIIFKERNVATIELGSCTHEHANKEAVLINSCFENLFSTSSLTGKAYVTVSQFVSEFYSSTHSKHSGSFRNNPDEYAWYTKPVIHVMLTRSEDGYKYYIVIDEPLYIGKAKTNENTED